MSVTDDVIAEKAVEKILDFIDVVAVKTIRIKNIDALNRLLGQIVNNARGEGSTVTCLPDEAELYLATISKLKELVEKL